MTEFHKIWIDQCEAVEGIEDDFGTQPAMDYLIGEKFLDFLEAAESEDEFRDEIPAFVARIKTMFEGWQLPAYLAPAKKSEPFDPSLFEGDDEYSPEEIEDDRKQDIRQCTRDLLLVERAREWLLDEADA